MIISKKTALNTLALALGLTLAACGNQDDNNSSDDEELQIDGESEGELSGVQLVLKDLSNIEASMLPESLTIDESTALTEGNNPCEGIDPISCQPNLLKVYLGLGKTMVSQLHRTVDKTSSIINGLSGLSGQTTFEEDDLQKVDYLIENSKSYALTLHSSKGAFIHLAVNRKDEEKKYQLIFDQSNTEEDGSTIVSMQMEYTSETSYNFELDLTKIACSSKDVRAPEAISIKISHTPDGHYGKAITYHPLWIDEHTCDSTSTKSTDFSMLTNFAGNDSGTTASIHLGNRTTKIADIEDWQLSDFCTNFPDSCQDGAAFGSAQKISTYENPICILPDSSSWDNECPNHSTRDYTNADEWVSPDDLRTTSIKIPTLPTLIE